MTARDVRICGGAEDHYLIAEDAIASVKRVATRIAEPEPEPRSPTSTSRPSLEDSG
jgi:hypothetical protein